MGQILDIRSAALPLGRLAEIPGPMDVERFLAFNDTRMDGEKWELIDGEPILNATPVNHHQLIVANLIVHLRAALKAAGNVQRALPGIGVRLSNVTLVEPDVMVRSRDTFRGNVCDDIAVAFEVLSPSTRRRDLGTKRLAYAGLASLTHYVAVSPEMMEVRVFARAALWREVRLVRLDDAVALPELGISLALAGIYDDMADFFDGGGA